MNLSNNCILVTKKTIGKIEQIKEFLLKINLEMPRAAFYQNLALNIKEIFEANGSAFYTYDSDKNELKLECVEKLRKELPGITFSADQGLLGKVVQQRKSMKIDDYKNWPGRSKIFEADQFGALLEAPVMCGNNFYGIIGLVRMGECKAFTDVDMSLLSLLAVQIAIMLELGQ